MLHVSTCSCTWTIVIFALNYAKTCCIIITTCIVYYVFRTIAMIKIQYAYIYNVHVHCMSMQTVEYINILYAISMGLQALIGFKCIISCKHILLC